MLDITRKIVLLCTVICIFGFGSCGKSIQSSNQEVSQIELVDASELDPADIAAYDREESEPFQGMPLKDCDILAITKSNDSISTKDIFKSGVLYVRYSQYACGDCINFVNKAMVEYKSDKSSSEVVLLLKDIEMRDIHVLENKFGKRFEIFKIDSLPTDFDEATTPYIFKLDQNLNVRDYYIPRKELPDSLHTYLYL